MIVAVWRRLVVCAVVIFRRLVPVNIHCVGCGRVMMVLSFSLRFLVEVDLSAFTVVDWRYLSVFPVVVPRCLVAVGG